MRATAHRPERGAAAVLPPENRHVVRRHPLLALQPVPGRHRVRHALARRAYGALADAALGGESARAEAVGEHHDEAVGGESLTPVTIARGDRSGTAGKPGASMERDHCRERAVAGRPIDERLELGRAFGNFHEFRRRRRGSGQSQERDDQRERTHEGKIRWCPIRRYL